MELKLDSSLFYAGVFDSGYKFPGTAVTEKRRVTQYEIEVFTESGGTAYINEESRNLRPGLVVCARPGDIRHTELPTKCFYVKISTEMSDITSLFTGLKSFFRIRSTEKCVELIKFMLTENSENDFLKKIAKLLDLIAILRDEGMQYALLGSIPQKKSRVAIELAIEYMEEHFKEKCTLEEVAAHAHFSPVYFHGMFRDAVGKTPYEYLSRLRINEAKRLLLTENTDMAKISELCGFSSQSYFNYVFKKETGLTPRNFRKQSIAQYCT